MATDLPDGEGPRSDAGAAIEGSPSAVATTAARALSLGAALTNPDILFGLANDLEAVGVDRLPPTWGGWDERIAIIERSDAVLADYDSLVEVKEREQRGGRATEGTEPERLARADLWRELSARPTAEGAVAWLRMLMTDREPVAAAAAAAALNGWRRRTDVPVPAPLQLARELTVAYAESGRDRAGQIAAAALPPDLPEVTTPDDLPSRDDEVETDQTVSIIVHGTAAWAGTWWFPGGDFHTYIRSGVRPDLFSGRQAFSWSGRYRGRDRRLAAERLAGWAQDVAGSALNTVFGHSYGGVIALHASAFGLRANEVVLMSVPVENVPVEWRHIGRATSLRIHMDLVLLAARRRQRFTENVEENYLPQWFWEHSDSHEPTKWQEHDCPTVLGL
jgi:pimeloyl-ACP methyl ester carboxylesterase